MRAKSRLLTAQGFYTPEGKQVHGQVQLLATKLFPLLDKFDMSDLISIASNTVKHELFFKGVAVNAPKSKGARKK